MSGPQQSPSFVVPTLLMRSLGLEAPAGATVTRVTTQALGFEIIADRFDFIGHEAVSVANLAAELVSAASKRGALLVPTACIIDDMPCAILLEGEPRCEETNVSTKDADREDVRSFMQTARHYIDADMVTLREFARVAGCRLRYCYSEAIVNAALPEEPGTINVFIGGRPPGLTELNKPVREAFGLELWKGGVTYFLRTPARGRGRLIEAAGAAVWQALGSTFYLLNLVYNLDQDQLVRQTVLRKSLEVLYRDLVQDRAEEEPEATADELAEFAEGQINDMLRSYRDDIAKGAAEIEQLERELTEKLRIRVKLIGRYDSMRSGAFVRELRERLPDELAGIKAIEGVTWVRLIDDGIHIGTTPVEIRRDGRLYDLGPFVIRLQADGRVEAWSDAPRHPEGHHHPHIANTSLTCFGNVTLAIAKQMAEFRFADAATIVMRWLRTYSPETTLHKIEEFPSVPIADDRAGQPQEACHG